MSDEEAASAVYMSLTKGNPSKNKLELDESWIYARARGLLTTEEGTISCAQPLPMTVSIGIRGFVMKSYELSVSYQCMSARQNRRVIWRTSVITHKLPGYGTTHMRMIMTEM
jgi:hypothetical protein